MTNGTVFISYNWGKNHANQKRVSALKTRLESTGSFKVWMDIDEMLPGNSLFDTIEQAIRKCQVFIGVITKGYVSSLNCKKEMALADSLGKPIIPVLFEELSWPPDGLGMFLSGSLYLRISDSEMSKTDDKVFLELTKRVLEYTGSKVQDGEFIGESDEFGNWIFGVYKTFPNGSYAGGFKNFKKHGSGIMNYSNGDAYVGGWRDGERFGKGIQHLASGASYEGDWKNGLKCGNGKFSWPCGSVYNGGWSNDLREGFGKFEAGIGKKSSWPANSEYTGPWKMGKREGLGRIKYENGDIYEGEFKNDKQSGNGRFWSSGKYSYEGRFSRGKKNGDGEMLTFKDDCTLVGFWEDDVLVTNKERRPSQLFTMAEFQVEKKQKKEKCVFCVIQ